MKKRKDPKLVEIGKQLGEYNKEKRGSSYFSRNGKISAQVRNAKFKSKEEQKEYYAALGRKSAAMKKAKKEAAKRKNSPSGQIARFLTTGL